MTTITIVIYERSKQGVLDSESDASVKECADTISSMYERKGYKVSKTLVSIYGIALEVELLL